MNQLDCRIHDYLMRAHNGRAWFKGGSYSYLFDCKRPRTVVCSDGGVLHRSWSRVIKDFADAGIYDDFVDTYEENWGEFFRVRVVGQENHETQNLRGD